MDDVWREIIRIDKKAIDKGFDSGESIYLSLRHFCDDDLMVDSRCQTLIRKYNYCKLTHTPPYKTLQETPAQFVDEMLEIDNQYNLIQKSEQKKQEK